MLGGSRSSGGKRAGPTIYEINAGGEGRSVRDMPRLVAAGLAITWRAGPRELVTMAVLELLSGIGIATLILIISPHPPRFRVSFRTGAYTCAHKTTSPIRGYF